MHRVGVVGAGRIGARRAQVAQAHPESCVVAVCDLESARAAELASRCGARVARAWEQVTSAPDVDIVVVATTHDALARVGAAALEAGKHVLVEKPMARTPSEARLLVVAAARTGAYLKVGYNHRYHPAVQRVQQACVAGELGRLLWLRGRYGHGGRPGYEREWRADRVLSGGGEMLDQGVHLVDLALWLLGDFADVAGFAGALHWPMQVEDNAFGLFRTAAGQVASLHVSWTQWRNLFSLEVCGSEGHAAAEGLGGSYGPERAVLGRRRPEGGPPDECVETYPAEDRSWELEWEDLLQAIRTGRPPLASGAEGLRTLEWVHRLYTAAAEGRVVTVESGTGA